ncbi:Adenosylmethionine--8-amino-7-oxononanoate transaminase [Saliniradius amylolyticus]|uniref:Adenosylmethionine--8-amino-7-oxononanoate transaminase n=1 Tax=Saliniradius amylolyticus TaxID=2183582 RepID=A0A2S2DZF0_9ALTE|nr:aminotransferase [Saliniradius amylolyticus]AWL10729.1 Adenosylmethionine--8-amino-7-oxononanoate transaminase [Saliniradius amylolyticus]
MSTKTHAQHIIELDKAHFTHPWTVFDVFNDEGALPIAKAEGIYITDSQGKRYLDAVGGLWCTNIGLGREEMADTLAEQCRKMAYANPFVDMTNEPATLLAAKLAELAPGDIDHCIFTCGGSTAVDSAYRLIQYYQNCRGKHEKKHIISRKNAYHGSTYLSMSIGGKAGDHPPEFDFIDDFIHHLSCPNFYRAPEGLSEQAYLQTLVEEFEQTITRIGPDKVAAFFAEPIMGAGGVIVPPNGYHRAMADVCQRHDILYVADEVVTAFGRLGEWFASEELFDVTPDIITCAKGITSGYQPLGACLYSDRIHQVISEAGHERCFAHGFTYSGHPIACAAALKNIEIIEREKLLDNARDIGPYFQQQMQTLTDLPIVGEVRGQGLMVCVENVADKNSKQLFPEALDIGKRISDHCEELGLIIRPIVHLNVMSPPLTITREEVDFIVRTLRQAILRATDDLVKEGLLAA